MSKGNDSSETPFAFADEDLTKRCMEMWRAATPAWHLVGEELAVYSRQLKLAAEKLTGDAESREEGRAVRIVGHDRWSGFRIGKPTIPACTNKTNVFANALQLAMMTREEIDERFPDLLTPRLPDGKMNPNRLPFDPLEDLIFVFESCESELSQQPMVATLLRDIIQANATSPQYIEDKENGQRGNRMLILITSSMDALGGVPELKPEIVPLPGHPALKQIVHDVFEASWEDYESTKGESGCERLNDSTLNAIIGSLAGLTSQDAEQTLALASVKHEVLKNHQIVDLDAFLETIEDEKGKAIAKIPGVRYIPKRDIIKNVPAGYEPLHEFLRMRMSISPEKYAAKGQQPVRGIVLAGVPGVAKTEVAKYICRVLNKTALLCSMGDMKSSLMGSSQLNMRKGLQAGRAMKAVMIWDDIDKGSQGNRTSEGDSGVGGDMNNAWLQDASDPTSPVVHVMTFNRLPALTEALRPGRIDKLIYVERPNAATRLAILKDHIVRWGMTIDDEPALKELADSLEGWTGAEIAHVLVKEEGFRCLAEDISIMRAANMQQRAGTFTPQSKIKSFTDSLAEMEAGCAQFEHMGNVPGSEAKAQADEGRGRARRSLRS